LTVGMVDSATLINFGHNTYELIMQFTCQAPKRDFKSSVKRTVYKCETNVSHNMKSMSTFVTVVDPLHSIPSIKLILSACLIDYLDSILIFLYKYNDVYYNTFIRLYIV